MTASIFFFEVGHAHYLPLIRRLMDREFRVILSPSGLQIAARNAALPILEFQQFLKEEHKSIVQKEVLRIAELMRESINEGSGSEAFGSVQGNFFPHTGQRFFTHFISNLGSQILLPNVLDNILGQLDPKLIVLQGDNTPPSRTLVNHAARIGIPTLQLAHGILGLSPFRVAGEMHTLYSQYVASYGERCRELNTSLGYPADRIFITGAPAWDHLYTPESRIEKRQARQLLGLDPEKPTILFAGVYTDGTSAFFRELVHRDYEILKSVLNAVQRFGNDLQLLIRPHPSEMARIALPGKEIEDSIRLFEEWLRREGATNVFFSTGGKIESIRASDLVISMGSSNLIPEAMILERPVFSIALSHQFHCIWKIGDGVEVVGDCSRLGGLLARFFSDPSISTEMLQRQNAVLPEYNYRNDGRATERVAELIEHLATNRPFSEPASSSTPLLPACLANRQSPSKDEAIMVSIIIPVFGQMIFTRACLWNLYATMPGDLGFEVLVVDNTSDSKTHEALAREAVEYPALRVIPGKHAANFAQSCNQAAKLSAGRYLLFMENDTEATPGWIEPLLEILDNDRQIAGVSPKLIFPDRTIQYAGLLVAKDDQSTRLHTIAQHYRQPMDEPDANRSWRFQVIPSACMLIRKSAFEATAGFDESYRNGFEDIDLCHELGDLGWNFVYQPKSLLIHYGMPINFAEQSLDNNTHNEERWRRKWQSRVIPDIDLGGARFERDSESSPTGEYEVRKSVRPEDTDRDSYNIVLVRPEGTTPSPGSIQLARLLHLSMRSLGLESHVHSNQLQDDSNNLLIGYHLLEDADRLRPYRYTIYQTQDLSDSGTELSHEMLGFLDGADDIWEFSEENLVVLRKHGFPNSKLIPLGYHENLRRFVKAREDIDVLLHGRASVRRQTLFSELSTQCTVETIDGIHPRQWDEFLARSKMHVILHDPRNALFEQASITYLLHHGCLVITEDSVCNTLRDGIVSVPHDRIVETCLSYSNENERRFRDSRAGLSFIKRRKMTDNLREALQLRSEKRATSSAKKNPSETMGLFGKNTNVAHQPHLLIDSAADSSTHIRHALEISDESDLARAIEYLQETVSLAPELSDVWYELGTMLVRQEELGKAIGAFENAIENDDDDIVARKSLAALHLQEGRVDESLPLYERILKTNPCDVDALLEMGIISSRSGREEEAIQFYERAMAVEPGHPVVRQNLATLRGEKTDRDAAQDNLRCRSAGGTDPTVSIVIPVYNMVLFTRRCLDYVYRNSPSDIEFEVLVVDNGSTDGTDRFLARAIDKYPGLEVLTNEENQGFAKASNQGARQAKGKYILFLNNDTEARPGWLEPLVNILDNDAAVAVVGSKLLYPNGTIQHAGMIVCEERNVRIPLNPRHIFYKASANLPQTNQRRCYQCLTGACMLVRKSIFREVGGFDEGYWNGYEDVDLCFKFQERGKLVVYEPNSVLIHHETQSDPEARFRKNHANLCRQNEKWLGKISPDLLVDAEGKPTMLPTCKIRLFNLRSTSSAILSHGPIHDPSGYDEEARKNSEMDSQDVSCRGEDSQSDSPAISTLASKVAIHWSAQVCSFVGYSRMSRQCILALDELGIEQSLSNLHVDQDYLKYLQTQPQQLKIWETLQKTKLQSGVCICFAPPTFWNGTDFFAATREEHPGFSAYVGITMFETDRLPKGWAESCNGMDEIWVPSNFNRGSFIRAGVDPERLQVAPFGMELTNYDPSRVVPLAFAGKRGFTFLSVFQWSKRKGVDVLIKAYLSAFDCTDDVCLLLRTYPNFVKEPPIKERLDRLIRQSGVDPARVPPILLVDSFVSEEAMPSLYAAADAFVLPTRGEGWGIPYMESMAMGLPVIGTRWSAHLDFMNDENSYLIDVERLTPVDRNQTNEDLFYTPDQLWAEPSVIHTAELMRHVYDHREEAATKGQLARRDILRNWSIDRTRDWILHRADHLIRKAETRSGSLTPKRDGRETTVKEESFAQPDQLEAVSQPKSMAVDFPGDEQCGNSKSPILWFAPIYDPSGLADEARNFVLNLQTQGFEVAVKEIARHSQTFYDQLDPQIRQRFDQALARDPVPDFINVTLSPAYAFNRIPGAVYNIGRTMFESDGLHADWVARCHQMDEIWVPTDFNLETFRKAGVATKLYKVPGGIDTEKFRPDCEPLAIPDVRSVVFLSMFEWSYRKGWDVLLRGWAKAFSPEDDVCLVMRVYPLNATDSADGSRTIEGFIDRFLAEQLELDRKQVAPIIVLGEQIPEKDLARFHAAGNALVAPSRGEGWGRPHMQAMACGLPVIATRWSGNLEFMNDENSLLIDIEGLVEIDERAEFSSYYGQRWAEPSVEHLCEQLRRVYERPDEVADIGRRARQDMVEHWQWEKVAVIAADRLKSIRSELSRLRVGTNQTERSERITVRWEGSQFVMHSMALVNREICIELAQDPRVDLSIMPFEPHQFDADADPRFEWISRNFNRLLSRPADIHVRLQWPPNLNPPVEGHWVFNQPWEFGSLPKDWVEVIGAQVDEVWAISNYVRECYIRSGVSAEQVHVIPLGVDADKFRPEVPPLVLETKKRFKFLFVGGTIVRKGIDILLNAYVKTFSAEDDVCLIIKDMLGNSCYKNQTNENFIKTARDISNGPEIEYIDRTLDEQELVGLYTACDCLVHPYRGEGFGLPIAEAMACELPTIVTGHGAALDFCNSRTSYLIPAKEVSLPLKEVSGKETVDFIWWADPDCEALMRLMLHVVQNPAEAKAKARVARAHIRDNFNWDRTARVVLERIESLSRKPIRRFSSTLAERPEPITVSVIVSTHDGERFIRGCLEDLEAQTIRDRLEIIVVDSSSGQNELNVVEEFRKRYDNIIQIRIEERETVYTAWNRGVKVARGKYITNANTDDRHRPDAFERMVAELEANPDVALVYADLAITDTENEPFDTSRIINHDHRADFDPVKLFTTCHIGPQPMWRRELHQQYGFFDENFREAGNYEFWLRMIDTEKFLHIPEVLGLYAKSSTSVEKQDSQVKTKESDAALERHWHTKCLWNFWSEVRSNEKEEKRDMSTDPTSDVYNIVLLHPPGVKVSLGLLEIGKLLYHSFRSLGIPCRIRVNQLEKGAINIVLGYQCTPNLENMADYRMIIYQLSQLHDTQYLDEERWLEFFGKAEEIWDYSQENLEHLAKKGFGNVKFLPIGFHDKLRTIRRVDSDIDVLFYGIRNDRRNRIIDELKDHCVLAIAEDYGEDRDAIIARSKIVLNIHSDEGGDMEQVRISYLLNNRWCVISEDSERNPYDGGIGTAPYDELVDLCRHYLEKPNERYQLAKKGYNLFRKRPMAEYLRKVLVVPTRVAQRPSA